MRGNLGLHDVGWLSAHDAINGSRGPTRIPFLLALDYRAWCEYLTLLTGIPDPDDTPRPKRAEPTQPKPEPKRCPLRQGWGVLPMSAPSGNSAGLKVNVVTLDTIRALRDHAYNLAFYCAGRQRWAVLDLERLMAEGKGD
jgi:hypothetical protein